MSAETPPLLPSRQLGLCALSRLLWKPPISFLAGAGCGASQEYRRAALIKSPIVSLLLLLIRSGDPLSVALPQPEARSPLTVPPVQQL